MSSSLAALGVAAGLCWRQPLPGDLYSGAPRVVYASPASRQDRHPPEPDGEKFVRAARFSPAFHLHFPSAKGLIPMLERLGPFQVASRAAAVAKLAAAYQTGAAAAHHAATSVAAHLSQC